MNLELVQTMSLSLEYLLKMHKDMNLEQMSKRPFEKLTELQIKHQLRDHEIQYLQHSRRRLRPRGKARLPNPRGVGQINTLGNGGLGGTGVTTRKRRATGPSSTLAVACDFSAPATKLLLGLL